MGRGQVSQTLDAVLAKGQTMPEKNRFPAVLQPMAFSAKDYGGDACTDMSPTLRAEGFDASEDGTGRGNPIVAQAAVAFVQNTRDEVRLMGGDGQIIGALAAETGAKQQCYIAQAVSLRGRDGGATAEPGGDVSNCLRASSGGGDKPHVLAMRESGPGFWMQDEIAGTLRAEGENRPSRPSNVISKGMQVRRLTPVECERLQGFPDEYTNINFKGKPVGDGHRYKALGNSWAVPNVRWIGERIDNALRGNI